MCAKFRVILNLEHVSVSHLAFAVPALLWGSHVLRSLRDASYTD